VGQVNIDHKEDESSKTAVSVLSVYAWATDITPSTSNYFVFCCVRDSFTLDTTYLKKEKVFKPLMQQFIAVCYITEDDTFRTS